jgi:hypothetical protein
VFGANTQTRGRRTIWVGQIVVNMYPHIKLNEYNANMKNYITWKECQLAPLSPMSVGKSTWKWTLPKGVWVPGNIINMDIGTTLKRDTCSLWQTFMNTQDYKNIGGHECGARSHCEEPAAVKGKWCRQWAPLKLQYSPLCTWILSFKHTGHIILTDEAQFQLWGEVNKHNHQDCSAAIPCVFHRKPLTSEKRRAFCFLWCTYTLL